MSWSPSFLSIEVAPLLIREQDGGSSSGLAVWIGDLCLTGLPGSQSDYIPRIAAFLSLVSFLLGNLVTAMSMFVISRIGLHVAG